MTKSILLLAALAALASCSAKESAAPTPSFAGKVQLTDEFGTNEATSGGVVVTLADTNPQLTTQTTADGSYSFTGVDAGKHKLVYTKAGYGTYRINPISAIANQTVSINPITLSQLSAAVIGLDLVRRIGDKYLVSGVVTPKPTVARPHRLYLQRYDYVVIKQPVGEMYNLTLAGTTLANGTFTDTITYKQLADANIGGRGDEILVWAAVDNKAASTFIDEYTNLNATIYPAAVPVRLSYTSFQINP
jgi:hypothetical protein